MKKSTKNQDLLDPMLLSIWELSGGKAYHPVPLKEVLHNTILKIGLDPDKEPLQGSKGWSLKLRMLFRSYMEEIPTNNFSYVSLSGYGKWSLTDSGVSYIKQKYPDIQVTEIIDNKSAPNETSIWLNNNYIQLNKYLLKNLPKTLKMSASLGSIEDHIQTFFIKIITNNALKPYITSERKISFSMLNAWAVRSAYSEFTTMGQEPVERVMRNAKTETELNIEKSQKPEDLANFEVSPASANPILDYNIIIQNNGDLDSSSINFESDGFDFELYSLDNNEDSILRKLSFDKTFNILKVQVSEAFSRSRDHQLALKILDDMILSNKNIQEMAESNATATSKVYSIINKIKEESFKAYKRGSFDF